MTIRRICMMVHIRDYVKVSSLFVLLLTGIFSTYVSAVDLSDKMRLTGQVSSDWQKISDEELDTLRGGFSLPNGLVVDFSFDKRIYKNGIEAFYSIFQLPKDIVLSRQMTSDLASDFSNMVLNSVTQNSLDNQIIKTINTINIDISNIKNTNFDANRSAFFRDVVGPTLK